MDKSFFENDPLDEPKQMPSSKKFVFSEFQEDGQKRKLVSKIEFTPLSDCKILSFFKGF